MTKFVEQVEAPIYGTAEIVRAALPYHGVTTGVRFNDWGQGIVAAGGTDTLKQRW